jgi:hypothetical protein
VSRTHSRLDHHPDAATRNDVTVIEFPSRSHQVAVHGGAVRRAQVGEPESPPAQVKGRVLTTHPRIGKVDGTGRVTANHHVRAIEDDLAAVPHRLNHPQPRARPPALGRPMRWDTAVPERRISLVQRNRFPTPAVQR